VLESWATKYPEGLKCLIHFSYMLTSLKKTAVQEIILQNIRCL